MQSDMICDQEQLFLQIQQLSFICTDLNLFLDTHPDNERAALDYSCYSQQLNSAVREYEEKFGPLNNFGMGYHGPEFKWCMSPWPWEYKGR